MGVADDILSLKVAARKIFDGQQSVMRGIGALLQELRNGPKSITEEIDAIPGRRIFYTLSGSVTFTASDAQKRSNPVTLQVSQDGPFVMTHYPLVTWRPTLPTNATNFGRNRPVSTWPLPDQVVDTDIIDIFYEFVDGGSQRNFQQAAVGPIFSRPDALEPLPVPTLFAPNAAIQFVPTYNAITFNDPTIPPTQGTLQVDLPGYRIVNI